MKHRTPPPPAPAPTDLLWGARIDGEVYGRADAPWDSGTWDLFEQHAGAKVSLLHFGQPSPWKQPFARDPFDKCALRGALPLCSMSSDTDSLAQIAAGTYDGAINAWAASAKAWAGPILLRWDWEMNGTWYPWARQPAADYIAAWRHLRTLLPANVEMVWCPNVIYPGSQPIGDRYPGDIFVQWLGIDGYNFGTNPLKPDVWRSFQQVFDATYVALAAASTKPILICETASTEFGGDKAAWITGMWQTLRSMPQVKGLCWFNWNQGGADWPIESSAAATSAFRAGVPA